MEIEDEMKKNISDFCHRLTPLHGDSGRASERGIALVFTLLMLALLMVLSLGMVIALSAQTFIGGYYRNFRGSFYAADSGLTLARQSLVNQLNASVSATFANPPIANPTSAASTVLASMLSTYGSSSSLNSGSGANSWSESFKITAATLALAPGSPVISYNSNNNPTSFAYSYNYSITSVGSSQGSEQSTVTENGAIFMNVAGQAVTNNVSFAYFGGFVDQWAPCTLGWLTPGTMTGPMFTNDAWEFGPGGSAPYIFTDPIGQHDADADYWTNNGCVQSPTASYGTPGNMIAPTFEAGLNLGQPKVPLPTDAFSQQWAVVDGKGNTASDLLAAPTNAQLSQPNTVNGITSQMMTVDGAPFPGGGASSGVYFNYSCSTTPCSMQGGGFLVEGNATIELTPSGASAQVFTITNNGITTTITVDPVANTTKVVSSDGATMNLTGVPENLVPSPPQPATMVYVNGTITSLTGPGEGQAAIQDNAMITLVATGDVIATGDVLYKTEPVTVEDNQIVQGSNPPCCNGLPMDSLITGVTNMNQVLGIYSATGNFDLNTNQPDGNIEVDGTIALISQGGCGGFLNIGPALNAFNNVGGQTQNCIYGAAINIENVWFDRRYTARASFAPPWFPGTTITQGGPLPSNVTTVVQRIQWLNNSAM
jgi:Tfp pilus assembly protein PilX